jgi:hypothetical protein
VVTLLIGAGEPSKVPFYIAGGVLVLWAVAVAGFGLSRPEFPGSAGRARGVMAVSVLLMVVAMAMAIKTSAFPK